MSAHKNNRNYREYTELINCTKWRNLRNTFLAQHPYCSMCQDKGLVTPATEVHHIIPVESVYNKMEMTKLAYSETNLQALCHACHRDIHLQAGSHTKKFIKQRQEARINRILTDLYGSE